MVQRCMWNLGLAMACCWSGGCSQAFSQEISSSERIAELVQKLEADSRSVRAKAEQDLINLGEPILEQLPALGKNASATVRDALQRIRRQVEWNAAEKVLQGQTLTLPPSSTLQEFLESLSAASGTRILTGDIPTDLSRVPGLHDVQRGAFLELLDHGLEQQHLGWCWGKDGRSTELTLDAEGVAEVPAVYTHGVRAKLLEVRPHRNFIDPETRKVFRLGMALDVDPRMKPSWANLVEADISLSSLQSTPELLNPQARREIPANGQRCLFPLDIAVPVRNVPDFVDVDVKLSLRVAVRQETLHLGLDDLLHSAQTTRNLRLWLHEWSEREGELEVMLRAEFAEMLPELESHRQGALHRDVSLTLKNGTTIRPADLQLLEADGLVHRIRYLFRTRETLDQARLKYVAPSLITELPLTFTLQDIPLATE